MLTTYFLIFKFCSILEEGYNSVSMASSKPTSNANKTLGFLYDVHLFLFPNVQGG